MLGKFLKKTIFLLPVVGKVVEALKSVPTKSEVWGYPFFFYERKPRLFSNMIPGIWPGSLMVKQQTYTLYYRQISVKCRFDSYPG